MDFKGRLKELREMRGLSQLELASKVHISNATISMYEKGVRSPSRETLETLADFFNVDIDYFLIYVEIPTVSAISATCV